MLPDVIGHENKSQHCPDHRCLCLVLSGRIITRTNFHTTPACRVCMVSWDLIKSTSRPIAHILILKQSLFSFSSPILWPVAQRSKDLYPAGVVWSCLHRYLVWNGAVGWDAILTTIPLSDGAGELNTHPIGYNQSNVASLNEWNRWIPSYNITEL